MSIAELHEIADQFEAEFEQQVESGTDHELFVSGYLQGHVTLIISQILLEQQYQPENLIARVEDSLNKAFANGELEVADQTDVREFWQRLCGDIFKAR